MFLVDPPFHGHLWKGELSQVMSPVSPSAAAPDPGEVGSSSPCNASYRFGSSMGGWSDGGFLLLVVRNSDLLAQHHIAARITRSFKSNVPAEYEADLTNAVRQLCEPDPALRGHPLTRAYKGNPLSLERYVSLFNRLASRTEWTISRNRT